MRRWNGWGDDTVHYPIAAPAADFLARSIGAGTPRRDVTLAATAAAVPPSRLPGHRLITTDPVERVRHAAGHSLGDWVVVRGGRIPVFPDGVAYPASDEDVRALLRLAAGAGIRLIPYGGGTSAVGHINPLPGAAPVLTVDMSRMNGLLHFDEAGQLATFGAGIAGPDLEAHLRAHGCTLGHFPQSFEYSTLGGWVATRSSGQQSLGCGRIERLFAGGRLQAPAGTLDLPPFPASAAGPDLRELVLGSEGRLGILTQVTVRAAALPEQEEFRGVFFPDFDCGRAAVRAMVQARLPLSLLRLSTAAETETNLVLAGHARLITALEQFLALRGLKQEKCMLVLGCGGRRGLVRATRQEALAIAGQHGGVHVGRTFGREWHKSRFRTPYLRNSLWDLGYAVETVETATVWANIPAMVAAVEGALRTAIAATGERAHIFTHLSHVYPSGSTCYTTFIFRLAADVDETLKRWQALKTAACRAIVAQGGTISHQHGVGVDHLPYLAAEKGELGLAALGDLCRRFDPAGLMNPGKLVA